MRKRRILFGFLVCFFFAQLCWSQLIRGFVSGTVADSGGAVIPGVEITMTNVSTGIARHAETNTYGFYRFVAVDPGAYSIEFKLPGFETRRIDTVRVRT